MFICDPRDISSKYSSFINQLKEFFEGNNVKVILQSDITQDDSTDKIEKSKLVFFFLTNAYIRSWEFKKNLGFRQLVKKFAILFVMEPLDLTPIGFDTKLNELNVFDVILDYETFLDYGEFTSNFYHLVTKIFNNCDSNTSKFNFNSEFYLKRNFKLHHLSDSINVNIIDVPKNNHLLVIGKGIIYIFNRQNMNFIKSMKTNNILFSWPQLFHSDFKIRSFCFVKCLNLFWFICNELIFSMSIDYRTIQNVYYPEINDCEINESFKFICHDENSTTTYLYHRYETKILVFKLNDSEFEITDTIYTKDITNFAIAMKIINDRIYFLTTTDIRVFDLDLNYLAAFGSSSLTRPTDISTIKQNKDYMYVLDGNYLKVFSLNNYMSIGSVYIGEQEEDPFTRFSLVEDSIIKLYCENECEDDDHLFSVAIFKTHFRIPIDRPIQNDNSRFVCKINEFKRHLLTNAYELPCHNFSCLNCIYDNYNIFSNEFKCPFENCKSSHVLKNKLVKSCIIEDNLTEICSNQLKYFDEKILNLHIEAGNF